MIRAERPEDETGIQALLRVAFDDGTEAELVSRLRAANRLTLSRVALDDEESVGYIAYSPVTVDEAASQGVGLAPLAVRPSHQHLGFGGDLINSSLDACRAIGVSFVVVLGEPGYYRRFGFQPASEFGLSSEYNAGDAFMALELSPGSLAEVSGLVRYAPEFSGLS